MIVGVYVLKLKSFSSLNSSVFIAIIYMRICLKVSKLKKMNPVLGDCKQQLYETAIILLQASRFTS